MPHQQPRRPAPSSPPPVPSWPVLDPDEGQPGPPPPDPAPHPDWPATADPDPERPTDHQPGSEGKLRVLAARAGRRLPLFHPDDDRTRPEAPAAGAGPEAGRDPSVPRGCRWDSKRNAYDVRVTLESGRVYLGLFADLAGAREAVRLALAGRIDEARALAAASSRTAGRRRGGRRKG